MAKKDTLTIDTDRVNSGIKTFNDKKKSYTSAYKTFKGSYLNTGGDATVTKLKNTVSGLYASLNSLYNGINSYSTKYINSVSQQEQALKDGLLSSDEETEIRGAINAVNQILNGADPTDIMIDPRTGEVHVNVDDNKRYIDIDPKTNGSLRTPEAKEANRDYLYQAHLAHPKLATFLDAWTPIPFELGNVAPYSKKQYAKIQEIKKKNTKAHIAGTIAGIATFAVIPGGGEAEGAKLLSMAVKGGASVSRKQLLKTGAKILIKEELKDAPVNFAFAVKEGYDFSTGKINWDTVKKSMVINVGIDVGLRGVVGLGKYVKDKDAFKSVSGLFRKTIGNKRGSISIGSEKKLAKDIIPGTGVIDDAFVINKGKVSNKVDDVFDKTIKTSERGDNIGSYISRDNPNIIEPKVKTEVKTKVDISEPKIKTETHPSPNKIIDDVPANKQPNVDIPEAKPKTDIQDSPKVVNEPKVSNKEVKPVERTTSYNDYRDYYEGPGEELEKNVKRIANEQTPGKNYYSETDLGKASIGYKSERLGDVGNYKTLNAMQRGEVVFDDASRHIYYTESGVPTEISYTEFQETYGISAHEFRYRQQQTIRLFQDAARKNPIGEDLRAVRKVNYDALEKYGIREGDAPEVVLKKLGGNYTDPAMTSVSVIDDPSIMFDRKIKLIQDIDGSTGAIPMSGNYGGEGELLLQDHLAFEPVNAYYEGEGIDRKLVIHMQQKVPHKDWSKSPVMQLEKSTPNINSIPHTISSEPKVTTIPSENKVIFYPKGNPKEALHNTIESINKMIQEQPVYKDQLIAIQDRIYKSGKVNDYDIKDISKIFDNYVEKNNPQDIDRILDLKELSQYSLDNNSKYVVTSDTSNIDDYIKYTMEQGESLFNPSDKYANHIDDKIRRGYEKVGLKYDDVNTIPKLKEETSINQTTNVEQKVQQTPEAVEGQQISTLRSDIFD